MAQAKIKMIPAIHQSDNGFSAPQKSSATFVQGAPVKLSAGTLKAVSVTSKSSVEMIKASSLNNVVGISSGKATSGATTNLLVHKIQEGMEFVGNLVHITASSAKVSKIGSTVYMGKQSTDTHYGWSLSAPSSTNTIKGIITRLIDAASTVNGRVQVQVTLGGALSAF